MYHILLNESYSLCVYSFLVLLLCCVNTLWYVSMHASMNRVHLFKTIKLIIATVRSWSWLVMLGASSVWWSSVCWCWTWIQNSRGQFHTYN